MGGGHGVREYPRRADVGWRKAGRGDRWGSRVYRKTAREFGPLMAMAARCAMVQVREVVALGREERGSKTGGRPAGGV